MMLQKGMKAVSYPKDNKWIDMIEQPAQEPAYQVGEIVNPYGSNIKIKQPSWIGLSDEEVINIYPCAEGVHDFREIVRAVEAKLKEKNI